MNRGLRLDRLEAYGAVYDSTKAMYQVRYPYLTSVPPYSTGSTFEQFVAYTAIDSVLQNVSRESALNWIAGLMSWNDTTKTLSHYYYSVVDDNPGEFVRYVQETRLGLKTVNTHIKSDATGGYDSVNSGPYNTSFSRLQHILQTRLVSLWPADSTREAFKSLLGADIIVRGTISKIDTTYNLLHSDSTLSYAVTMTVLDTVKGQVLPGISNRTSPPGAGQPVMSNPPPTNTIQFEYIPELYPKFVESRNHFRDIVRDTAFTDSDGSFKLGAGQQVIVFLRHMNGLLDDDYDYFTLSVDTRLSGGALLVAFGEVKDPNNVWGTSGSMSISAWEAALGAILNSLTN
jgi:hypothetical protein